MIGSVSMTYGYHKIHNNGIFLCVYILTETFVMKNIGLWHFGPSKCAPFCNIYFSFFHAFQVSVTVAPGLFEDIMSNNSVISYTRRLYSKMLRSKLSLWDMIYNVCLLELVFYFFLTRNNFIATIVFFIS